MANKKIFLIAGEASGDEHAAQLINELNQQKPELDINFSGIGGDKMAQAGMKLLYPLAQFGVTGATEVIKQFLHIRRAYKLAEHFIKTHTIDLLILIDYPGFNLRFAKLAKKHNIKILYYISPQIWAWKANRIHTIKRNVDAMAVILPFEKDIYQKANVPAYFVGNPLTKTCKLDKPKETLKKQFDLSNHKKIVGLLPGSRSNEVHQLLDTMIEAAQKLDQKLPQQLQFVLPIASSLDPSLIENMIKDLEIDLISIQHQSSLDIMACCDTLIVASGTASLQAALLHIPMVVVYKASRLTYLIATQVIQCAYLSLANLIPNRLVVPELVQDDYTVENVCTETMRFLCDTAYHAKTVQHLKKISKMLENKSVDCKLAHLVFEMLLNEPQSLKDASKSNQNSQFEANKTSDSKATPVESPTVTRTLKHSE